MKRTNIEFGKQTNQSALKHYKVDLTEVLVFKSLKNATNIDYSVTLDQSDHALLFYKKIFINVMRSE